MENDFKRKSATVKNERKKKKRILAKQQITANEDGRRRKSCVKPIFPSHRILSYLVRVLIVSRLVDGRRLSYWLLNRVIEAIPKYVCVCVFGYASMMNVSDGARKEPIRFLWGILGAECCTSRLMLYFIPLWLFPYDKCLLLLSTYRPFFTHSVSSVDMHSGHYRINDEAQKETERDRKIEFFQSVLESFSP